MFGQEITTGITNLHLQIYIILNGKRFVCFGADDKNNTIDSETELARVFYDW